GADPSRIPLVRQRERSGFWPEKYPQRTSADHQLPLDPRTPAFGHALRAHIVRRHQADHCRRAQDLVRVPRARARGLRCVTATPELAQERVADLQRGPALRIPGAAVPDDGTGSLFDAGEAAVAAEGPVPDVQGEAAPGFGAIERLAGEEAGHFGIGVHRGERVEVLGADGMRRRRAVSSMTPLTFQGRKKASSPAGPATG